ncbi:arabinogalactan endo-beta-1,4-galactanase, partial [Limosilactobacillus sp.]|uniref:glycoside hydrolase family 53 protein n=1 Tax=Limosilactobacillus sp. TaxID=2773925 RepID=UPI0035A00C0D
VPSATVTNVYSNNATVNNPLTVGTKVDNAELSGALAGINNTILTGPKGETIPQNILQLYFDALKGAEGTKTGLVGQKLYSNQYGNYHYVYWLETNEGKVKNDAWTVFMNNNKGVKYGDPIKVDVSATLTWGKPAAKPVSGIPTTQMTADQITTAYATGSDTGARHEAVKVEKINNFNNSAARGVDIGSLISLERAGVTFYDFKGQKADLFDVLQQAGVNYIRCRLWNDPYDATMQTYGGGASDEATLIQLAKRAKAHGMSLLMDFHYSDFWADPATQLIPKAWEGEDTSTMAQSVYDYTKKVLQDLKATGVNVGMVQVGNEITRGILISQTNPQTGKMSSVTDGNYWTNEKTAAAGCAFLSAGSRAVREVMPNAKIALHLEGANQGTYRAIMNVWKNHGVDYDILATSAYLFWLWSNKQYTVWDTINGCISMIKNEFGKKVIITETSWPFTDENSDGTNNSTSGAGNAGYAVSPQGQVDAMRGFYNEISSNYRGTVLGSFWWEPAWIPAKAGWNYYQYNIDASGVYGCGWATEAARGYQTDDKLYWEGKPTWGGSSWDNQALFDDQGHPLQSLMMFHGFQNGYTSANYDEQHNNKPTTPTEKATSTLTAKVSEVYFGDGVSHSIKVQNPLTVGATLNLNTLLGSNTTKTLTGVKGAKIGENGLDSILMSLNEGINTPEYTDAAGNKYHYQLWLDGATTADKQRDFSMTNQNKNYGDNLVVHYTATLMVG